ncbi:hypothetical protein AVEN_57483-1 [Araneus ventricosus]|uniref:Helitron helicase-like domain-containing protein n=1 Tax=Araneus ventricosus TaxID=182803 RepID=A0A4Y2CYN3_ARAVE|nr:hypothetical protein AVEN_57483-1 [Araneus ventricosus]
MVHGPCESVNPHSPCMKDGICTKQYPRPLLKETQTGQDGYPLYRRRSTENWRFNASINFRGSEVSLNNTWVVPYCSLLTKIFISHINVEYCNSVKSIKYIHKRSDMAVFELINGENNLNEIHQYQMGRYIRSNEAVCRILKFPIHERHPIVIYQIVHLGNGNYARRLDKLTTMLRAVFDFLSPTTAGICLYIY